MPISSAHPYVPEFSIHQTNLNWQESNSGGAAGDNLLAHPALVQELEAAQRQVAVLTAHLEASRSETAQVRAETAQVRAFTRHMLDLLERPDMRGNRGRLLVWLARLLGITPDHPNLERPHEWRDATNTYLHKLTRMGEGSIGGDIKSFVAAGYFRRRVIYRTNEKTGQLYPVQQLAPPEGEDWERTWGNPAGLPIAPPSHRRKTEAQRQSDNRTAMQRELDRLRAELTRCPSCDGEDFKLGATISCNGCGEILAKLSEPLQHPPRRRGRPRRSADNADYALFKGNDVNHTVGGTYE